MNLLSLSDGSAKGDDDHAVAKTVEDLSATESDTSVLTQERDVRPIGGNASR